MVYLKDSARVGLGYDCICAPPPTGRDEVSATLVAIPWEARTTSLRKLRKILVLLRSITPVVSRSRGMFARVQHALKQAVGRHAQLTTDV